MSIFSSLTRNQKEALALLQIGTFLEYFDLMLYVHMAVLLNELFFEPTNSHTAALISAFAFCSTYVLRPFGALIFGYIGDNIGRKTTVIITTMMMSASCVIMANLPTYAQIGIAATWIVTLCRIVQGLSSMGEIIGATVYMTESIKPPAQYPVVSFVSIASSVGSAVALGIASLVTHFGMNWRIAFWIGAGIAVVGSIARTRLRETPEFVDAKMNSKLILERKQIDKGIKKECMDKALGIIEDHKVSKKTRVAYFLVYCGWPISFYLAYMYFNPTLKELGYTPEDIIQQNFVLSILLCVTNYIWASISYRVHPLIIIKYRTFGFIILAVLMPFILSNYLSSVHIFIIQALVLILTLGALPGDSVFIQHIPVLKRFTITSFLYALTRAAMYIITSFGLVYLTDWFGFYGLWFILVPLLIGYLYGINHYEKLEKEREKRVNEDDYALKRLRRLVGIF